MDEVLTHEQLIERLRTGWQLLPTTPGLKEAARELIRPVIEAMRGREIIYRFRVPWLIRIDELHVDDDGFSAVATPIQEIKDGIFSIKFEKPFTFGGRWDCLHMSGSAVCMNMISDHFFSDPNVVAEVKAAAARNAQPHEIHEILTRPRSRPNA